MTPEPIAPASDLDAAVATVKRNIGQYVGASPVVVQAANLHMLLDALSSQASVMEEMAKGLGDIMPAVDAYLMSGDVCARGLKRQVWEQPVKRARTALSQYRTLGDE